MFLKQNDHIVFFGDSITDCGQGSGANEGLGNGYPMLLAAHLNAHFPAHNFRFTNAGISGNRVYDLEARLQNDVLNAAPSVVSILIGISASTTPGAATTAASFPKSMSLKKIISASFRKCKLAARAF